MYVFPVAVAISYWQSTNMHLVLSVHVKGVLWYVFTLAKICATCVSLFTVTAHCKLERLFEKLFSKYKPSDAFVL